MKATLKDNKIIHNFNNGHNNELADINDAVCYYDFYPTYENFQVICCLVRPEMLRGAVNPDNYGKYSALHCDIVHLALVYMDIKPMAYLDHKEDVPEWIDQSGLKIIHKSYINHHLNKQRDLYIIYKNDEENAIHCAEYMENKRGLETPIEHHYILGKYLGYPKKDTDYWSGKK